ncbi:MAG: hypothetical protein Alpg2KO_17410 [Alphaproteobacteria bacterium]
MNQQALLAGGEIDTPLTDKGRQQAETAARLVAGLPDQPSIIVHSHLSRARDTAQAVAQATRLDMVEGANLQEHMVGDWAGTPYLDCRAALDRGEESPNGETLDQFAHRVGSAIGVVQSSHPASPLIVAHGGLFRAFARLQGWGLVHSRITNCALCHFVPRGTGWDVHQWQMAEDGTSVAGPSPFAPL